MKILLNFSDCIFFLKSAVTVAYMQNRWLSSPRAVEQGIVSAEEFIQIQISCNNYNSSGFSVKLLGAWAAHRPYYKRSLGRIYILAVGAISNPNM